MNGRASEVPRLRLLIFVVAYNAERTIQKVLARIPSTLANEYQVEVLVVDDSSADRTFERGHEVRRAHSLPFPLHVLYNPVNQGYGGNQKIGFHFAIEHNFDFVALVHGDGQYAPECLPDLVKPLAQGDVDAVFGSRMLDSGSALAGGMPLYKFVGNKILTAVQNRVLRTRLSEFHSGYRVYAVDALRQIPFDLNTNDFHFDTEIIIQLVLAEQRIAELPIPTYYGDEICHVDGLKYAWDVVAATARARTQEWSLLYDRRFDVSLSEGNDQYVPRLGHENPHTLVLDVVEPGSRVLDLGCAGGYVGASLRENGCVVTGIDVFPLGEGVELDAFYRHDLNDPSLPVDVGDFDYVLLLDVIEHLRSPERFLDGLAQQIRLHPEIKVIVSTGNVAFVVPRLLLLMGQFNYGKRGILDLTHTRLFTFSTLRRLLEGAGLQLVDIRGTSAPFPLALGERRLARLLLGVNEALIRLRKQVFAYQIVVIAQPRPSLERLLEEARAESRSRIEAMSPEAPAMTLADRGAGGVRQ